MSWLKIETNTPDKPEVWAMSDALGIDADAVFGKAFRVWRWFDEHTENGNARGVTFVMIDRIAGVTGFAQEMSNVGWLIKVESGIELPNFDRHNGQTAKKRANTAVRVANHKIKGKTANAGVTPAALPIALPREDKSQSKDKPPIPPKGGESDSPSDKKSAIAFKTFLENCRSSGEKPIPEGDTVFAYADATGIPLEFLRLHWMEFKERYSMPDAKRYKDWRAVYRKSVRACWFKLWYLRADGACGLTTQGEQAKRHHGKEAA
jgi:hypothetical protein